ncbi:hypothetical protein AGMMS49983_15200 [Clostridia bacterium]|nr:hypothetical protein AGMMS49983_15200 [Clostridia bacterium]
MKLIIVSGFLGAGKTISILSLADHILKITAKKNTSTTDGSGTKLVIIENEIGDVGFDDAMLSAKNYEVKNMLAGCICCTLASDLTEELHSAAKTYDPEYVIFEPTGVAFPKNIIGKIEAYATDVTSIRIVTVVDAYRWQKLIQVAPLLVQGQVQCADLILLNKADLVSTDLLETVRGEIRTLNPTAKIATTVAQTGIESGIWDEVLRDA